MTSVHTKCLEKVKEIIDIDSREYIATIQILIIIMKFNSTFVVSFIKNDDDYYHYYYRMRGGYFILFCFFFVFYLRKRGNDTLYLPGRR